MTFWKSWEHLTEKDHAWKDIYRRDRYQCASPTCTRRDISLHHIVFIFFGGTDDPNNLLTVCSWCHLEGIHTYGSIRAEGSATDLTWKTTVLEVRGRDLVWKR
jgi:5-methylcytosine-specific restriction endonuclease McrA